MSISTYLTAAPMATTFRGIPQIAATPSPSIQVSVSTSPDYFMDGLTFFLALFTLAAVITAIRSLRAANKQHAENHQQQEAALQIAREANTATLQTIEEMQAGRDQDSAPYMIAYFEFTDPVISFVAKNIGKSIASNIRWSVDPPFVVPPQAYDLNNMSFFKEGIAALAPGQELRTTYSPIRSYLDDPPKNPRKYTVTIKFKGGISPEERTNTMFLDIAAIEGTGYHDEKGLEDLVKEVERLRETLEVSNKIGTEVVNALKEGIWIKNPELPLSSANSEPKEQLSLIATRLQAFKMKWQNGYKRETYTKNGVPEKLVRPLDANTRNDCTLYSQQIVFALVRCQSTLPTKLAETIMRIAASLLSLGNLEVDIPGKGRVESFNDVGETILQEIEEFNRLRDEYLTQLDHDQNGDQEITIQQQNGNVNNATT